MTPKKQLIDIFAGYKATYETMQREKQQIDSDPYTTPAGKETRMQELFNRYKATVQGYHDKAAETVNNGIAGLNEKWVSTLKVRITDAGYQIGLQNVLVMIENKAISRPEDMQAVVETYKGDYTALALTGLHSWHWQQSQRRITRASWKEKPWTGQERSNRSEISLICWQTDTRKRCTCCRK